MSVINQVLKDLDRQGANTRAPRGVIAVDQTEPGSARRPLWLGSVCLVLLAAVWRWWPTPLDSTRTNPMPAPALSAARRIASNASRSHALRMSLQLASRADRRPGIEPGRRAEPRDRRAPPPQTCRDNPPAGRIAFIRSRPDWIPVCPNCRQDRAYRRPRRVRRRRCGQGDQTADAAGCRPRKPGVRPAGCWNRAASHDARQPLEAALSFDPAQHDAARQNG
jgi:hypothetical protein